MSSDMIDLNDFWDEVNSIAYSKNVAIPLCKTRECPYCKASKAGLYCNLMSVECPLDDHADPCCHSALIKREWKVGALKYLAAHIVIDGINNGFSSMSAEKTEQFKDIAGFLDMELFDAHRPPQFRREQEHLC